MTDASDQEIQRRADQVIRDLRACEAELDTSPGRRVERIDETDLLRGLAEVDAGLPFFSQVGWSPSTPGDIARVEWMVQNPGSDYYSSSYLMAYMFVGPANAVQSDDLSLLAVDTRFPHYWRGLALQGFQSAGALFEFEVPVVAVPAVYLVNCYLVLHDVWAAGKVIRRSSVDLEIH